MPPLRSRWSSLSLSALLLLACADGLAPGDRLLGQWGSRAEGQPRLLIAMADSATLRLACATARFMGPLTLDTDTAFAASGTLNGARGGERVQLAGRVHGSALELTLTYLDLGGSASRFELRRGERPDFSDGICLAD